MAKFENYPDIIERILLNCIENHQDLKRLTLVCKKWKATIGKMGTKAKSFVALKTSLNGWLDKSKVPVEMDVPGKVIGAHLLAGCRWLLLYLEELDKARVKT